MCRNCEIRPRQGVRRTGIFSSASRIGNIVARGQGYGEVGVCDSRVVGVMYLHLPGAYLIDKELGGLVGELNLQIRAGRRRQEKDQK